MTTNDDCTPVQYGHTRGSARNAIREHVTQQLNGASVDEAMIEEIVEAWIAKPDAFVGYREALKPFARHWLAANYDTWTERHTEAATHTSDFIASVEKPGVLNYLATIAVNKCTAGFVDSIVWRRELTAPEVAAGDWSTYLADAGWTVIGGWRDDSEEGGEGVLTAYVEEGAR